MIAHAATYEKVKRMPTATLWTRVTLFTLMFLFALICVIVKFASACSRFRSARPSMHQLRLRRLKNMTVIPGISQAPFVLLVCRGRFRDYRPVRRHALPFPAMVVI